MLRGIYTAASAMRAQETAQAVIANNLANAATPGYKGDVATFESFRLGALTRVHDGASGSRLGTLGAGTANDRIALDLSAGPVQQTGNALDVAAGDNQFFVVRTPRGDRLTRAGAFTLDGNGTLVDAGGNAVLGTNNAPIRFSAGAAPTIGPRGDIVVDKSVAARLKVVALTPGAQPVKEGGRLMQVSDSAQRSVAEPSLVSGALEMSNVSVVEEMVGMITAMRAYEAAQKAVQSEDQSLGQALSEVART